MRKIPLVLAVFLAACIWPANLFAIWGGSTESGYEAVGAVMIDQGGYSALATGTLIGGSWVLTAAHAVDGVDSPDVLFYTGDNDVTGDGDWYAVKEIYVHPAYDEVTGENDVALLELSTSVTGITPVSLYFAAPATLIGANFQLVGWGNDSEDLGAGKRRRCALTIAGYDAPTGLYTANCSSCGPWSGDSGAPAIMTGAGQGLAGTLRIAGPGLKPVYAEFVSISGSEDFISETMAGGTNTAPAAPKLVSPADGVTGLGAAVTFSWNEAEDADGDSVRYELYVATQSDFSDAVVHEVEGPSPSMAARPGLLLCSCAALLACIAVPGAKRRKYWAIFFLLALVLSCSGPGPDPEPELPAAGSITHEVTGLLPGTVHYWAVMAIDGHDAGTPSGNRSFSTAP